MFTKVQAVFHQAQIEQELQQAKEERTKQQRDLCNMLYDQVVIQSAFWDCLPVNKGGIIPNYTVKHSTDYLPQNKFIHINHNIIVYL